MGRTSWTNEQLTLLHSLTQDGKNEEEIAKILGKTAGAVKRKFRRVNWDTFLNSANDDSSKEVSGIWNQAEMGQLWAFLESGLSYNVIASHLGRGLVAVERKAQTTDWKAWKMATKEKDSEGSSDTTTALLAAQLVDALIELSRSDHDRLEEINEKEFRRKINFEKETLPISFDQIKTQARRHFEQMGLENPEEEQFGEGTYLIVGDSHGKFTKTAMFSLIKQVEKELKIDHIFHVGHLLDDDNDISYNWGKFKKLTIISKTEELHLVQERRNKFNFNFNIVRGCVNLGDDLRVMNQDMITDYVKTPISSLDQEIFDDKVIVNNHRFEFMPKTNYEGSSFFASPGAICERHIVKTIKQIDFDQDRTVKVAYHSGFTKYRRMKHMYRYWKQGMIVVHIDNEGKHTVIPCIIRNIKNEFVTSYFDKIITSSGVKKPDEKILVVGDLHCPSHNHNVLDIVEQICKDYKPDILVNVGDTHDYKAINHHDLDKGNVVMNDLVDDSAATYHVCKRMSTWAKKCYIIYGNHERFAYDFIDKYPQFKQLLDLKFLCNLKDLGYDVIELQDVLRIGPTNFIHGELKMYGQSGSTHEKASRTFGENTFFGHVHYTGIRFGGFSVGLLGLLDQGYNEINASRWVNGVGFTNHYCGKSFPTTISICSDSCRINKKVYKPCEPSNWKAKEYKAKLVYY